MLKTIEQTEQKKPNRMPLPDALSQQIFVLLQICKAKHSCYCTSIVKTAFKMATGKLKAKSTHLVAVFSQMFFVHRIYSATNVGHLAQ